MNGICVVLEPLLLPCFAVIQNYATDKNMNSAENTTAFIMHSQTDDTVDFTVGTSQQENISVLTTQENAGNNEYGIMDYTIRRNYTTAAGLESSPTYVDVASFAVAITKDIFADNDAHNLSANITEYTMTVSKVILGIFLCVCCMVTILGNILVMVAIARMSYLQTVTNLFIASLAVADLLVGFVIVPFTITLAMTNDHWLFGVIWCDLWRSFDVLSATASILNLSAISLDRYWAITNPMSYPGKMSFKRAFFMIFLVWFCSVAISFPAIAWWRYVDPSDNGKTMCLFTDDVTYRIISSCISFYIPLFIMAFVYYKIYRAAVAQMKSLNRGMKILNGDSDVGEGALTLRIHRGGGAATKTNCNHSHTNGTSSDEGDSSPQNFRKGHRIMTGRKLHISKRLIRLAKERKAAKTLGIVMGVFIICWLPFFVLYVLYGICGDLCVIEPELLYNIFTCLGYLNSGVNPFIYAFSSRDFKRAFIKILCTCMPRKSETQMHIQQRHRP